ncbi:MAG: biotin--[acetyl-CoA-carboxylase] ligase [Porphyromonadaceae bacterium]|jgi:BirA family biotin operon repressor/biotin-[acetyl-CoA-carboxylase] ligase|nr:biotin--[acetyl-CoA-carboxylase] ligase [Porphyromonadaceae bacterium]
MLHIPSTISTNTLLKELSLKEKLPEGYLVSADFQTAGKGQPGNSWESENGKNLLFSILLYPKNIKINEQFILSQLTCLAIKKVLDSYTDDITIKWSNDIYWKEKKICGILIENSLFRDKIDKCIIGIGLNVNQEVFTSNAPNPVSLKQITGKEMDREKILSDIYSKLLTLYREMDFERIQHDYHQNLYRKDGFHPYIDAQTQEHFLAKIENVEPDGKLILTMENGERKEYYFKEVIALPNLPAGEIWGRTT